MPDCPTCGAAQTDAEFLALSPTTREEFEALTAERDAAREEAARLGADFSAFRDKYEDAIETIAGPIRLCVDWIRLTLASSSEVRCPECDHLVSLHVSSTGGCEVERGDGYVPCRDGGEILSALGPCGCRHYGFTKLDLSGSTTALDAVKGKARQDTLRSVSSLLAKTLPELQLHLLIENGLTPDADCQEKFRRAFESLLAQARCEGAAATVADLERLVKAIADFCKIAHGVVYPDLPLGWLSEYILAIKEERKEWLTTRETYVRNCARAAALREGRGDE